MTATNVADRLWEEEKLRVDRRKLQMDTIKRIGRYTVPFEVFADVVAELKLVVAPEGQELPPEEELAALEAAERAEAAAEAEAAAAADEERRDRRRRGGRCEEEARRACATSQAADEPDPPEAEEPASNPSRPQALHGSVDDLRPASVHRGDDRCGIRAELPAKSARFVHYTRHEHMF